MRREAIARTANPTEKLVLASLRINGSVKLVLKREWGTTSYSPDGAGPRA